MVTIEQILFDCPSQYITNDTMRRYSLVVYYLTYLGFAGLVSEKSTYMGTCTETAVKIVGDIVEAGQEKSNLKG